MHKFSQILVGTKELSKKFLIKLNMNGVLDLSRDLLIFSYVTDIEFF